MPGKNKEEEEKALKNETLVWSIRTAKTPTSSAYSSCTINNCVRFCSLTATATAISCSTTDHKSAAAAALQSHHRAHRGWATAALERNLLSFHMLKVAFLLRLFYLPFPCFFLLITDFPHNFSYPFLEFRSRALFFPLIFLMLNFHSFSTVNSLNSSISYSIRGHSSWKFCLSSNVMDTTLFFFFFGFIFKFEQFNSSTC